jgi:prepilin-type N-terminal cleavage/methylation domain-containing protein
MKIRLFNKERGDTIVEVMIAIAIIAFVLGAAYYTANTSYRNDIDSEEHSEALTIAQAQLEELRIYGYKFNTSEDQCLINGSPSNSCTITDNTVPYTVKITNPSEVNVDGAGLYTFVIQVNWQALGGGGSNGQDYVTLYYRVDSSS